MKTVCAAVLLLAAGVLWATDVQAEESSLNFGRFGTVTLYRSKPHPANVILFVSGDGGWNQGVVDMARELAGMDALVAGIDIVHYLKQLSASNETCSYPAADFENLSHDLQKRLGFPQYLQPVLIGYSSGATLVYAILAQAPPGTFLGAMSLGFCPDLPLIRPLCKGSGLTMTPGPKGKGIVFQPAAHLKDPWIALQGEVDQVCDPSATRRFVGRVAHGEVVMLPTVGHGYSVPRNWMPQFRQAFRKITARQASASPEASGDLADLPIVEVLPGPAAAPRNTLAVIVTGDGGWAGIDQEVAAGLSRVGLGVVGLNTLKYFWTPRSPERFTADLERLLSYYLNRWHKDNAILVGYSMGADVLPFAVNRLSADIRSRVRSVTLLAPGQRTAFEFHLSNWIGGRGADTFAVQPEIEHITGPSVLCVYGALDTESVCPRLPGHTARILELKGGHHFGGNSDALVAAILSSAAP